LSDHADTFKNLESHDPLNRIFALSKVNKALKTFSTDTKISKLDKRLLKGFYVHDIKELEGENMIKLLANK
jgi:hypothetical protein